jgi:archaeosortase A (PGF-CTERM-specific)
MGLLYAPLVVISPVREQLILLVTNHTAFAMDLIGYNPPVVTEMTEVGIDREIAGKEEPLQNTFVFWPIEGSDVTITYSIIIACTGIGSMAVMAGLIAAVKAPLRRKLGALAVAMPIIYVLNIVRNVFIGISYGHQYADFVPGVTMTLFGLDNPLRVSYIWVDRIIAQSLSVVAMVLILWLVIKLLPEVMGPVEDVLFLLTGEEYDLAAALNVDGTDSQPGTAD